MTTARVYTFSRTFMRKWNGQAGVKISTNQEVPTRFLQTYGRYGSMLWSNYIRTENLPSTGFATSYLGTGNSGKFTDLQILHFSLRNFLRKRLHVPLFAFALGSISLNNICTNA